jgi:hypothetical protein
MTEPAKNKPGIYTYLIILVVATIINSLLARYAEFTWSSVSWNPSFYFAVSVMIPLALWFGGWGTITAYLGCFIGAGIGYVPFTANLYWSLADLWQVLIPLVAFRNFHTNAGLKTKRDFVIFFVFGWLLNNLAGAIWGPIMFAVGGVNAWDTVLDTSISWFTGNLIVTLVVTTLLLKYITPYIERRGLLVKGYWS